MVWGHSGELVFGGSKPAGRGENWRAGSGPGGEGRWGRAGTGEGGAVCPPACGAGAGPGGGNVWPAAAAAMSLPVVLPGSCCPVPGLAGVPQAAPGSADAPPPLRARWGRPAPARRGPGPGSLLLLLPARPLLSLGLLQLVLGCGTVALSFGALALSGSARVKSACPFWAGSAVSAGGCGSEGLG